MTKMVKKIAAMGAAVMMMASISAMVRAHILISKKRSVLHCLQEFLKQRLCFNINKGRIEKNGRS